MGFQVGFQNITDFAQIGTKDMSFLEERSPHWEYIPGTLSVSGPSYFNNTPNTVSYTHLTLPTNREV